MGFLEDYSEADLLKKLIEYLEKINQRTIGIGYAKARLAELQVKYEGKGIHGNKQN